MQKYNALETPSSVGAQIKEDTRFMVHIAGVLRNAHPEVSGKVMGGFYLTSVWLVSKCRVRFFPVHRGICPFVSDPKKCPAEMSEQTCSQDSDCSESSKCCYCGCVRRCTPILSDEPGD